MSSKRHLRRTKCERKIPYPSAPAAKAAARRYAEMDGDLLTAYPCGFGSHWHLGHPSMGIQRAIAEKIGAHKARRKIGRVA